ncbi:MAG: septal ring lytic transglycosylase RlpA family protein [Oceanospirillaceae bacterium]|nr:septal ring lytic transglycosylase RlpA family protein [Oceanospirillaceae bacterium]
MNNHKSIVNLLLLMFVTLFIAGCANKTAVVSKTNEGRYKVVKDYGPDAEVDVSHVKDAVPKIERLSPGGNRSRYEVLGKNYSVMASSAGYSETGGASWYGKKFHGYLTANGEKYDMFKMTAAHKSLPIPTYVQVTNMANGRKVIVRVNDRGPFHKGRIIDLSYAAAAKLDMLKQGTSQVEVVAIDPATWTADKTQKNIKTQSPSMLSSSHSIDKDRQAIAQFLKGSAKKPKIVDNLKVPAIVAVVAPIPVIKPKKTAAINDETKAKKYVYKAPVAKKPILARADIYKGIHYIQVGVYSSEQAAHAVTLKVNDYQLPVLISEIKREQRKLYKVILGPVKSRSKTLQLTDQLASSGFPGAHLVDLPK